MRKLLLAALLLLTPRIAWGQVSGVGNIGCPGATTTGTVANSGTANNTVLATVTATPCPAVLVQLDQTTTITGGAITFNLSNDLGTNYTAVPVAQVINQSTFAQLTNPYTLVASTNQAFLILLNGATYFQVKLTTALTGTGAVTPYVTPVGLPPGLALNANGLAKVDNSGVTQPISCTAANCPMNLAQVAGTNTVTDGTAGVQAIGGHFADNGVAASTDRSNQNTGIYQTDYANGTAATQGRNAATEVGTDGLLWTAQLPAIRPASYHANANFAASSTTDNAVMPGNATNTVLVTKIMVSCTQTTAGITLMKILKRSTADTSGTSAAITAVPDDSNYAAASSAPLSYTGTGPTVGTLVGNVDEYYLGCLAAGTATPNDIYVLNLRQKPIVLRGTAQQLAVNFNNAALTGGNLNVTFEWIETKTILP
jgi:hypothetical protein